MEARFWSKVAVVDASRCWWWLGSLSIGGYGKFRVGSQVKTAHRLSYEQWYGPIPQGLQIDHLCRVRSCVNPAHLEAVTPRINILRGISPSAIAARATHCPQQHPYSEDNTYYFRGGAERVCKICKSQNGHNSYMRSRYGSANAVGGYQ